MYFSVLEGKNNQKYQPEKMKHAFKRNFWESPVSVFT